MVFQLYFELRSSGNFDGYATVLLAAIAQGRKYQPDNEQYRRGLAAIFDEEKVEYTITHREEHVLAVETALE